MNIMQYLNEQHDWYRQPDCILIDNPSCTKENDITSSDFNILMNVVSNPEYSLNPCLPSISNTMLLYAHDYSFYNVFSSNQYSLEQIANKLINLIFFENEKDTIKIKRNDQWSVFLNMLQYGITLDVLRTRIEENRLVLKIYVHDNSKFGALLFSNIDKNAFKELVLVFHCNMVKN